MSKVIIVNKQYSHYHSIYNEELDILSTRTGDLMITNQQTDLVYALHRSKQKLDAKIKADAANFPECEFKNPIHKATFTDHYYDEQNPEVRVEGVYLCVIVSGEWV